jgi:hypothetical protein
MKRLLSVLLIYSACQVSAFAQQGNSPVAPVVHVATALNHLTVLEFHEPVTMAAAGSSDFQIERQENKVFVKPVKAGVSTDLFVWTASTRFTYELETTAEVKNMNFAIDTSAPAPDSRSVVNSPTDQVADMMLTRAFLGSIDIMPVNGWLPENEHVVRVEQIFRSRSSIYVHYTIENRSGQSYRIIAPVAYELRASHPAISLPSLVHRQLDDHLVGELHHTESVSLPIAHAESAAVELAPGQRTEGVVAIRQDLNSPTVVQLVFDGRVKATIVL